MGGGVFKIKMTILVLKIELPISDTSSTRSLWFTFSSNYRDLYISDNDQKQQSTNHAEREIKYKFTSKNYGTKKYPKRT